MRLTTERQTAAASRSSQSRAAARMRYPCSQPQWRNPKRWIPSPRRIDYYRIGVSHVSRVPSNTRSTLRPFVATRLAYEARSLAQEVPCESFHDVQVGYRRALLLLVTLSRWPTRLTFLSLIILKHCHNTQADVIARMTSSITTSVYYSIFPTMLSR